MSFYLSTSVPIVAAPMAGGPTTVELSAAVAGAGGFPFLAAGYLTPEVLRDQIERLRAYTDTFGVNVFVPSRSQCEGSAVEAYANELAQDAGALGVVLSVPEPVDESDHWDEKIELLSSRMSR